MDVYGKGRENIVDRVNSKCKGPAAGANLTCSRNTKAATVAGME